MSRIFIKSKEMVSSFLNSKSLKALFLAGIFISMPACKGTKEEAIDINNALGKENLVDVLVLGSGPAGLAAAGHCARSGFNALILEGNVPGGQLTRSSGVENFPGFKETPGQDLIEAIRVQTEGFGVEFLSEMASNIDFSSWPYKVKTEDGMTIHAMSIVVATGSSPRMLDVPGEQKYYGHGVSICAICDGPFYKNQDVVVVGGGDSAVEEAIQLVNFGAAKVTVLVRADKMRAIKAGQERLRKEEKVVIKYDTKVLEVLGDGEVLTGIKVQDKTSGQIYDIPASGVFLAIGSDPNTGFLKGKIDMDERGCLKMIARSQQTTKKAVYAAGDVEAGRPRQAIIAAGMGAQSGIEAVKFLTEELGLDRKFMSKLSSQYFKGKGAKAKQAASVAAELKHLENRAQFDKEVIGCKGKLILVDFYTESCTFCKLMPPIITELLGEYAGKFVAFKIDAMKPEFEKLVEEYNITRVPRLMLFKDGNKVEDIEKALSKQELKDLIQKHI